MKDQATDHNQQPCSSALWALLKEMPKTRCEQLTLYGAPVLIAVSRSLATYFGVIFFNGALKVVFSEASNVTGLEHSQSHFVRKPAAGSF